MTENKIFNEQYLEQDWPRNKIDQGSRLTKEQNLQWTILGTRLTKDQNLPGKQIDLAIDWSRNIINRGIKNYQRTWFFLTNYLKAKIYKRNEISIYIGLTSH